MLNRLKKKKTNPGSSKIDQLTSNLRNRRKKNELGAVGNTYNPRHSGGRDQNDCGSGPTWAKSL
jgi:hypothetical protein